MDSLQLLFDSIGNLFSENYRNLIDVVTIVGAWYALRFAVDLGYHTVAHFNKVARRPKNLVKDYGRWAIITGCTSGIGKQFTYQLAERGLNIILIARNADLSAKQARFIEKRYSVRTRVIILDFTKATPEHYTALTKEICHLEIGILINNAGLHYDHPMQFVKVPLERVSAINEVNMSGMTLMTRSILPIMISRKKGLIVNISSGAGWKPFSLISLYSASKAFVSHFSSSLSMEVREHNIIVQTLEPMYLSTRMTKFSSLLTSLNPDARTYVRNAMKTLGRSSQTTAYYSHTIQMLIIKWCPEWMVRSVSYKFQEYLQNEGMKHKVKVE